MLPDDEQVLREAHEAERDDEDVAGHPLCRQVQPPRSTVGLLAVSETSLEDSAMPAQDDIAIVRRGYEWFNSGNIDELAGIFANDVVWHVGGRGRLAGVKTGKDATFAYFGQLDEGSDSTFRAELHDLVGSDDHVVGLHTGTAQRSGRSLNAHEALVFHLRDGKIVEAWEHYGDSQAWDEFWA
jgi:ketosteroid isomerase-like protein